MTTSGDRRTPAVSVLIPCYKVSDHVGEALASVAAQSFTDWEALILDDGSPDPLARAVAPFMGDRRFRLLRYQNAGVATARNRGAAAARAPLLALLDGDDRWHPDYLARMTEAIDADEKLGFVTCDAASIGAPLRKAVRFSEESPQEPPITLERVLDRRFNIFYGCIVRRDALSKAGGFDPSLAAAEDLDLWLRLLGDGWGAAQVAAPLVEYRRRAGSRSVNRLALQRSLHQVYAAAADRLKGKPEAEAAEACRARHAALRDWAEGEHFIAEGEPRRGIALLGAANAVLRKERWDRPLRLLTRAPWLAAPLLAVRHALSPAGRRC